MSNQKKDASSVQLRGDHLLAAINYCVEQAESSGIEILSFGSSDNQLEISEQIEILKKMQQLFKSLVDDNCEYLTVVNTQYFYKLYKSYSTDAN